MLSDLATGLGALPFIFVREFTPAWYARLAALSGGMMVSVSVFSLAGTALMRGQPWEVCLGMCVGTVFLYLADRWVHDSNHTIAGLNADDSRRGLLMLLAMTAHSFPEGVAIGVGYATGEIELGLLIAIVISVHNIPEGVAISLPLRAKGVSVAKCAWYSVLSSLPQPIAAVPAFLLVSWSRPLLPAGLGFAAGAMIFLVVSHVLPDALEDEEVPHREVASWFMAGIVAMALLVGYLDG